jgi:hypothetical protein
MQPQLTPEQQQAQLIAAKERERADNSRFASNLVYSHLAEQQQQQPAAVVAYRSISLCGVVALRVRLLVKSAWGRAMRPTSQEKRRLSLADPNNSNNTKFTDFAFSQLRRGRSDQGS